MWLREWFNNFLNKAEKVWYLTAIGSFTADIFSALDLSWLTSWAFTLWVSATIAKLFTNTPKPHGA